MNNVYDLAHKLARALKTSEEYLDYLNKKEKAFANEENKKIIEDYREKIMQLQIEQMSGKEVDKKRWEKMEELEKVLMLNPTISVFLQAEHRFSQMVYDINKIIGEAVEIDKL